MGTFGSDRYGPADIAEAVKGVLQVGYRLVDCAAVYGNEPEVGESLRAALDSGVPREDLFVDLVDRAAFYEHVRGADTGLIVATGERRTYANVLLTIGIA